MISDTELVAALANRIDPSMHMTPDMVESVARVWTASAHGLYPEDVGGTAYPVIESVLMGDASCLSENREVAARVVHAILADMHTPEWYTIMSERLAVATAEQYEWARLIMRAQQDQAPNGQRIMFEFKRALPPTFSCMSAWQRQRPGPARYRAAFVRAVLVGLIVTNLTYAAQGITNDVGR